MKELDSPIPASARVLITFGGGSAKKNGIAPNSFNMPNGYGRSPMSAMKKGRIGAERILGVSRKILMNAL